MMAVVPIWLSVNGGLSSHGNLQRPKGTTYFIDLIAQSHFFLYQTFHLLRS